MKILDRLPIATQESLVLVRQESVRLKEAEIIVWVSLTLPEFTEWHPATPRFPAILDTGHTHNFAIQQHPMNLPRGIAVFPDDRDYPRLPLLGLRAIIGNKLHLAIDGERGLVNLRTPDWKTRLLRWLA